MSDVLFVGGPIAGQVRNVTDGMDRFNALTNQCPTLTSFNPKKPHKRLEPLVVYERVDLFENEKRMSVFFLPDGDEQIISHLLNAYANND